LTQERDLMALIGAECVLVRPDQHIAWRGELRVPDPESVLRRVGHGPNYHTL
jgi:hypothetical protein